MKRYIGQAKDLDRRLGQHWKQLEQGTHRNKPLQNAYNKYGRDAFFVATTPCSIEDLTEREQYFIDTMWNMSYNICKVANVPPNVKGRPSPLRGRPGASKGRPAHNKGKPSPNKGKRFSPAYLYADEIIADKTAGLSLNALIKKYKTSLYTIKDILTDYA